MAETEEEARPLEVFDTNVDTSKRVAYSKSIIVFSRVSEPMQRTVESKMGNFVHLFQNNHASVLEQTANNLALVKREPELTLLKKDINGVPSRKKRHDIRLRHIAKLDNPPEKTVIEKIVKKISPKKPKGKKGKGK